MAHMTLAEFWQQQAFAYLETYSFNRGPKSVAEQERLSHDIAAARQALQTVPYTDLAKLRRKLRELEAALRGGKHDVLWTIPAARPDYATQKIATLTSAAGLAQHLGNVAARATTQELFAMCAPIYRDALVFYNEQHERLQVLNICFECHMMRTSTNQLIEADITTYEALLETLAQLGHPIRNDAIWP